MPKLYFAEKRRGSREGSSGRCHLLIDLFFVLVDLHFLFSLKIMKCMCDWNVTFRLCLAENNSSNATETSTSTMANISIATATIGKLQQQTTTT